MVTVQVLLLYGGDVGPPPLWRRRRESSSMARHHGVASRCDTTEAGSDLGLAGLDLGSEFFLLFSNFDF
jgi:hypothetical protein